MLRNAGRAQGAVGKALGLIACPGAERTARNGDVADSLAEAKAAFRAAWERPLPEGMADAIQTLRLTPA